MNWRDGSKPFWHICFSAILCTYIMNEFDSIFNVEQLIQCFCVPIVTQNCSSSSKTNDDSRQKI